MATATTAPDAPGATAEDGVTDDLLERLISVSIGAVHDAWEDVDWEAGLDPTDPALTLPAFTAIGSQDWYRALPAEDRARIGLRRMAQSMRTGWEFENILQQGLLVSAFRMSNRDPRFRYVHHELVEESHHSMMFHEYVRRYAPDATGMPRLERITGEFLGRTTARWFPSLFYVLVLGGELPIDHIQRKLLKHDLPPLVRRILEIHVEEEARHVSFANNELRRRAPAMGPVERFLLALLAPVLLARMARMMALPSGWVLRGTDGLDRSALATARRSPAGRTLVRDSVGRLRTLLHRLDLIPRWSVPLWRLGGTWEDPARA